MLRDVLHAKDGGMNMQQVVATKGNMLGDDDTKDSSSRRLLSAGFGSDCTGVRGIVDDDSEIGNGNGNGSGAHSKMLSTMCKVVLTTVLEKPAIVVNIPGKTDFYCYNGVYVEVLKCNELSVNENFLFDIPLHRSVLGIHHSLVTRRMTDVQISTCIHAYDSKAKRQREKYLHYKCIFVLFVS